MTCILRRILMRHPLVAINPVLCCSPQSVDGIRSYAIVSNSTFVHGNSISKASSGPYQQFRRHYNPVFISPFDFDDVYDVHDGEKEGPIILPNNEAEFVIVGGGAMGLSLAYHLWRNIEQFTPAKASKYIAPIIAIIEKDPSMAEAATSRAVGGIRQQFSHPCNIKLSIKSAEYLRNIKFHLGTAGHDLPDIQFNPQGYLFLATKDGAQQLMDNYATQVENGAKVMLLTNNKLKELFPWINAEGIELACYGLENEGWFDPWSLMEALKVKLKSFGVRFIKGEVVGLKKEVLKGTSKQMYSRLPDGTATEIEEKLTGAYVKLPDVDKPVHIKARAICNCAGPWAKEITEMLGVGVDDPSCTHPIVRTPVRWQCPTSSRLNHENDGSIHFTARMGRYLTAPC